MLLIILCFFISVTCVTDESKKLIKECQEEKDIFPLLPRMLNNIVQEKILQFATSIWAIYQGLI